MDEEFGCDWVSVIECVEVFFEWVWMLIGVEC